MNSLSESMSDGQMLMKGQLLPVRRRSIKRRRLNRAMETPTFAWQSHDDIVDYRY